MKMKFIQLILIAITIPSLIISQRVKFNIRSLSKINFISTNGNNNKLRFLDDEKNESYDDIIREDYNYTTHYWIVKAQIGEPDQEFDLELDTTLSTTWVPSVDCINCNSEERYNASDSRTSRYSNHTIKIEDYLGDLRGKMVHDDFRINDLEIDLRNFAFVEATALKKKFDDAPEGKLALGKNNRYGDQFSILTHLHKVGKISQKKFTLEFEEYKNNKQNHNNSSSGSSEEEGVGVIHFGDLPEKLKNLPEENFGFCNITTSEDLDDEFRDGWICELSHIYFNKKNDLLNLTDAIQMENTRVIFDSSYEFIGVSENQYDLIYQNYILENFKGMCRKSEKNDEKYLICNLDKNTIETAESLYFILQGYVLEIPAEDLFIKLDNNHNYLFAIKFIDEDDSKIWLLGQAFLKNFITIYDVEKDNVSFYSENVYDNVESWLEWYNSDYYSILLSRYFYLAIGACIVVALFLLFVCFLVMRSIKRRNLGHGPLIENEVAH